MGLFDIFRRHKKKKEAESAVASEEVTSATSAASETTKANTEKKATAGNEVQPITNEESAKSAVDEDKVAKSANKAVVEPVSASTKAEEVPAESTTPQQPEPELVSQVPPEEQSSNNTPESETVMSEAAESGEESADIITEKSAVDTEHTIASTAEEHDNASAEGQAVESTADASEDSVEQADEQENVGNTPSDSDEPESSTEDKYDKGLAKSRTGFGARLNRFLANFRHVDEDFFDDLEDMLIESDVGYDMAMKLSDELREEVKLQNAKSKQDVSNVIIEKMVELYDEAGKGENPDLNMAKEGPTVIMFVGVNGAGKTTTIGKMAALFKRQGKKVLLAAADTFRAGATEQLDVWAQRDGVDIVTGPENGDPAAVVFDAVQKAKKENYDILFVDTAGRLQNKVNLMKELAKMKRILTREIPEAPHEVLLVLDATTGQNALNQAKLFKESTDVTGIVLTKLDGTARGGIVLAIRNELHLPVKYVGLGEKVDDLQKFDASDFVYGLFKGLVEVD